MEPRNRFREKNSASLCSPAGRYDNSIPTRFLAPIECLKLQLCLFLLFLLCPWHGKIWGWNFKQLPRKKLGFTWGCAELLSMALFLLKYRTRGQIHSPWLWDRVNSDIGLLYRPYSLCILTRRYGTTPYAGVDSIPPSQGLWIRQLSSSLCLYYLNAGVRRSKVSLRWQDLRLSTHYTYRDWLKIPLQNVKNSASG